MPTTPFSRKTKILSLLLFFFFFYASPAQAASVRLSDVRKGEVQQAIRKPQSQEMMFQPIGDYAMDVNWMHIRFKLNLAKPEEHTAAMKDQLRAVYESPKQDHKRFPAIPALIDSTRDTLMRHHETYRGTLAVLPTSVDHHRVKRQLALIGGIVGTIFGAMNQIEIIKIF